MFSLALVSLLAGLHKNYSTDFHKNRKKPLDFSNNLDHVTSGLVLL